MREAKNSEDKMMNLYPNFLWLFVFFNLLNWFVKGQTLFSWWWTIPVVIFQIILEMLMIEVMRNAMRIEQQRTKNGKKGKIDPKESSYVG